MSEFNQSRREGEVKFGYDFNSVAEVTHLWGLTATKLPYSVAFTIPDRENAICLMLSRKGGEGWINIPHYGDKMDARGWKEIVRVDEVNEDPAKSAQRVVDELSRPLERYVFWHEVRDGVAWYKFYGIFKIDAEETRASQACGKNVCVYRKISDVAACPKCDVQMRTISAEEFESYANRRLVANLLDTIPCSHEGKERPASEMKVLPGQTFRIERISSVDQVAICRADDMQTPDSTEICFAIPKRDIELGYFSAS